MDEDWMQDEYTTQAKAYDKKQWPDLIFNEDCDCCVYVHAHDEGFIEDFHPEVNRGE